MEPLDYINLSVGALSLALGMLAMVLSVIFFLSTKKVEAHNIELLATIKIQVDNLKNINDNLLSTAIHHLAASNAKLIDIAAPLGTKQTQEKFIAGTDIDHLTALITIYFYTARSFYFASLFKQNVPLTDETKSAHVIADDVIKNSKEDFISAKNAIDGIPEDQLKGHHHYQVVIDINNYWVPFITNNHP